jgi:hypothetical protein
MTIAKLNRYDTSLTTNVFQYIGPSNDGRRHGRGNYLFDTRIEISTSNNSQYHIPKVLLVSALARYGCQSWTFSVQMLN